MECRGISKGFQWTRQQLLHATTCFDQGQMNVYTTLNDIRHVDTMVKWAQKLQPINLRKPRTSPKPKDGIVIGGKVCVELCTCELYAGGDHVSILYAGGKDLAYLDVTPDDIRVVVQVGSAKSTLAVVSFAELRTVQLIYKNVEDEPDLCVRTGDFVLGTGSKPHRLFRCRLKDMDLRSIVVERICQIAGSSLLVLHVDSTTVDQIFRSRIHDSDEDTIEKDSGPDDEGYTSASSAEVKT